MLARKLGIKLSSFQIIILGFATLILISAVLLMLPISSRLGKITPFSEALFTATSAVCVTGLVVRDTGSYWSTFGQTIIFLLIQIGGLGVITVAASFALISGRKMSILDRSTMQDAISAHKVGGIVRLTKLILKGTFIIELIGATVLLVVFVPEYGLKGVWFAIFHSVSAFCNAGFDLFGTDTSQYNSLVVYSGNILVNITIIALITIGGIGFLTWDDIYKNKHRFRHYSMQSKVILLTSLFLVVVPALIFFCVDFKTLPLKDRFLASLFQSVTCRTAGFNTVDISKMLGATKAIMIVLMIIGGSPGSTAGGMKTTTFAVMLANLYSTFRKQNDVHFFSRRVDKVIIKNASTVLMMYLSLLFIGAVIISLCENLSFEVSLYETASAVGTVGLTLGVTPSLGLVSRLILIMLMFFGRVGGLTLIYATLLDKKPVLSQFPQGNITVG